MYLSPFSRPLRGQPKKMTQQKSEVSEVTIRRRLFISNILMLVIPILLSVMLVAVLILAIMGIFGINISSSEQFYHVVEIVQPLSEKWEEDNDIGQIKADMDALWTKYGKNGLSIAIYQDEERVYTAGPFEDSSLVTAALSEPGGSYYSINNVCLYTSDVGAYKIVLMDTNDLLYNGLGAANRLEDFSLLGIFLFAAVIVIILVTNRLLTRKVIGSIVTPLDTLVYGVHQIRDGNLDYRIEYTGKDEFAAICVDFNEMAERLLDMVNARQKDEENRKELIAGISHDLRTPLTSIKTYVEGFELGMASTPQMQKKYLDTIKNKTKDLEYIINQLFLFSKLDVGEFPMQIEQTDIGKWLSDFVNAVSDEYRQKGLQIIIAENIQGVVVRADSVQLRNVLTNILENSLKYGNKERGIMSAACREDNANVMITLTDNGPGVPDDALDMLFNVFYREDKARTNTGQGSGLGLAISAKIINRLGGTIRAANALNGGLSITITLPVAKGDR